MSSREVGGKVAIVTGGGSGIGEATSKLLSAQGAALTVADIRGDSAQRVASEIVRAGGRAEAFEVDVSDEGAVQACIESTVQIFGRLDVLHNNATAAQSPEFAADGAVTDMSTEVWDRIQAVNLRGAMLGCKHAIPIMIVGGGGSIINMSSGSSKLGDLTRTAYGCAKAGVNALTTYVATQYGRDGIRANVILPGPIVTPAHEANVSAEFEAVLRRNVLTPYLGTASDVANLVLFLASADSRFITGQELEINGGLSSHQPHYAERVSRSPSSMGTTPRSTND